MGCDEADAAKQAAWRAECGRPALPNRHSWVLLSGALWCGTPDSFGSCTTCYNRFVRWRRAGVWGHLRHAFAAAHDELPSDQCVHCARVSGAGQYRRGWRTTGGPVVRWPHPARRPPPIPSRPSLAVCAAMSIPYRRAAFSPKIFRLISKVRSTWYSCFRSSGNSNAINFSISHLGDQIA
jgi:transposase